MRQSPNPSVFPQGSAPRSGPRGETGGGDAGNLAKDASPHSLSKRLSLGLGLLSMAAVILALGLVSAVTLYRTYRQVQEKADDSIHFMVEAMRKPLWDLDKAAVEAVAEAMALDQTVGMLEVRDNMGDVLFRFDAGGRLTASRESRVEYEGDGIGLVKLGLNDHAFRETLWAVAAIGGSLGLLILIAQRLSFARLLRRRLVTPLNALGEMVSSYSPGGDSPQKAVFAPYEEFQPLVQTLADMGNTIRQQMSSLRESEQRFRSLLEDVDMVAVRGYDVNRGIIYWNTASERLYGFSRQEVLGRRMEDVIIPESVRNDVIRRMTEWVENNRPIPPGELELIRKDGSKIATYTSHVMQENAAGNVEMYCIDVELTEIKKAHDQLLKAKEEAESANRIKSEFLANMSHEIRTPLNGVLGMLQLLRMTPQDEEHALYADEAINSAKRLARLLTDILDLTRVEAGRLTIREEPFSLSETVSQVAALFMPAAAGAGLDISWSISPDIPDQLVGDQVRLQQILNNLVGNAVKFTESGSISIEAHPLPQIRDSKLHALFSVTDTGIGIPDDKIEALFEPFRQASEGYTRKYQGAGLGLSICKRLVSLMGGHIAVDSQVGRGTTFRFRLAFDSVVPPDRAPLPSPAGNPRPRQALNVLLAEDDRINAIATRLLLERSGHAATVVEDGRQAVEVLRSAQFDIVLMDVQMPDMNGVQATRAIREGEAGEDRKDVPVIALTAYAMSGDKESFLKAGMNDYIAKPFTMEKLERVLAGIMGAAGGKDA